uniref:Uncharacterized protein n=1 Tax=viral metagenome TaxID=1070528 RepID=A0A6M3MGW0_9ZZZZ
MTFPAIRPKATPAPCAGIKRPAMTLKRYPGFILENQETGRASTERRKAISKAAV